MKRYLFLLLLLGFYASAQVKETAVERIKKLSSDEFHGRGYVQNGMRSSAEYIRKELQSLGVQSAADNFFQYTPAFPVNTFPFALEFSYKSNKADEKIVLDAGKDYLLHPSSGAVSFKNKKTVNLSSLDQIDKLKDNALYYLDKSTVDPKELAEKVEFFLNKSQIKNSVLLIRDTTKFTWYPSMKNSQNAVIYVKHSLPESKVTLGIKNDYQSAFKGINVIGKVEGKRNDSAIFISAHYDHLGRLGEHLFPGANDNASGVAMVLSLAAHYAQNKPQFDTYFLFTCGEEIGLVGSYFYIQDPIIPLSKIKLLVNLDMVGTGDEGIAVVNGLKYARFVELVKGSKEEFAKVKIRGEACNSDHCLFDKEGVPAVFIYTLGGQQAYHDVYDQVEGLSLHAYEALYRALIYSINEY